MASNKNVLCQSVVFEIVQLEEGQNGVSDCKTTRWLTTGIIFSYAAIPMQQLSRSAMMNLVSTRCSYRCRCPIHTLSLPSQFSMTNLIHGCFTLLFQSGFGYCLHCSIVGLSRKMFQSQLFYHEKLRNLRLLST